MKDYKNATKLDPRPLTTSIVRHVGFPQVNKFQALGMSENIMSRKIRIIINMLANKILQ